ncbi:hypothetical protein ACLK1S_07880 [Escherichia coli]
MFNQGGELVELLLNMVCFWRNRYRCASDCVDCRHYCQCCSTSERQRGELRVNNLSEQYKEMKEELAAALMDSHQQKQWHKAQRKAQARSESSKSESQTGEVATDSKPRVWVLDFKGSMDAHEVNSLRER